MDINIKIALIGFIGTLIGAFVSCGTTFLLDLIKCNREEKTYYKRKREETYIEMQDFLTELNAHWHELRVHNISNTIRIAYNSLRGKAHIYAKKETRRFLQERRQFFQSEFKH